MSKHTSPFRAILCSWIVTSHENDKELHITGAIYHDIEEQYDDGFFIVTDSIHFGRIVAGNIVTTIYGDRYLLASKELSDTIADACTPNKEPEPEEQLVWKPETKPNSLMSPFEAALDALVEEHENVTTSAMIVLDVLLTKAGEISQELAYPDPDPSNDIDNLFDAWEPHEVQQHVADLVQRPINVTFECKDEPEVVSTEEVWARLQEKIAEHDQRLADLENLSHRHFTTDNPDALRNKKEDKT